MKERSVFRVLLVVIGMGGYWLGWVEGVGEAGGEYVEMMKNDAVGVGVVGCRGGVVMVGKNG